LSWGEGALPGLFSSLESGLFQGAQRGTEHNPPSHPDWPFTTDDRHDLHVAFSPVPSGSRQAGIFWRGEPQTFNKSVNAMPIFSHTHKYSVLTLLKPSKFSNNRSRFPLTDL
jgi:hypothetical protein